MLEFHGVRGLQFRLAGMMSRSMISRPIWAKISHNRPSVCLRFSTDSAQGSKFSEALAMKPSGALGDRAAALAAEMESNKAVEGTIAVRRQKGIFGQIVKWGLLSGVAVGAAYTYFNYDEVVAFTGNFFLIV